MQRPEVKECQKIISDYMTKGNIEVPNGNTPSPISPTNSVGSQVRMNETFFSWKMDFCTYLNKRSTVLQSSGSNTPPCSLVPLQVHGAFQRQGSLFNYLVSCHDLWDQADALVKKGNHTGK